MRFYPHWLDPEEFVRRRDEDDVPAALAEAERRLKLRALLDETLVLNDVQPYESGALLRAFRQDEFRAFLHDSPEFLALTVPSDGDDLGRFWRATRGLRRSRQKIWQSSTFDRNLIEKLINALETDGGLDLRSPGPRLHQVLEDPGWRNRKEELEGLLHSVHFFAVEDLADVRIVPAVRSRTFYDVLVDSENDASLDDSSRQQARAARAFIDTHPGIAEADKHFRSATLKVIDFTNPAHWRHWKLVVESWNRATEATVQAHGGSSLLGNHRLGLGLGQDKVLEVDMAATETAMKLADALGTRRFDLNLDCPWPTISEMRSAGAEKREDLWYAAENGDGKDLSEAANDLFSEYAKVARPHKFVKDRKWVKSFLIFGSATGYLAGVFLDPGNPVPRAIGAVSAGGLVTTGEILNLAKNRMDRSSIVRSLRRDARLGVPINRTRRIIPRLG